MYGSVKIILEENNHVSSNKPVNKTTQFTPGLLIRKEENNWIKNTFIDL